MDNNQRLEQNIDAYVSGRMDEQERTSFEKEIANNRSIQEEITLQKDIVKGIKQHRHDELKSRLAAIEVNPFSWSSALQTTTAKVIYGVIALTGISVIAINLLEEDNSSKTQKHSEIVVDSPADRVENFINIPQEPEGEILEAKENVKETTNAESNIQTEDKVPQPEVFTPSITLPSEELNNQESDFIVDDSTEDPKLAPNPGNLTMIDVQIHPSDNALSFKYFAGKLSLFGDFSKSTYEVLELYTESEKKIYLYYDGEFYTIFMTRVTIPLRKVNDEGTLSRLKNLTSNK